MSMTMCRAVKMFRSKRLVGLTCACACAWSACSSGGTAGDGASSVANNGEMAAAQAGVSGQPMSSTSTRAGAQARGSAAGRGVMATVPAAGMGAGASAGVGPAAAGSFAPAPGQNAGASGGAVAAAGSGGGSVPPAAGMGGSTPSQAGSGGTGTSMVMPGAGDLWVSPDGADSAPGTEAMPLSTLAAAVERMKPGNTIWVRAGTYKVSQTVSLKAKGDANKPLRIFAAPGERPAFDFAQQPRGQSSARGLQISGEYWHLRGLEIMNAGDNCIHISGSHNTVENVVLHGCDDTGLQITAGNPSDAMSGAYNTVLNCDSYANYDEQNQGENADGFAAKLYIGPGNVFRGCRAWNNADDGWDLFASDDVVVIDHCWAIANGKIAKTQNNSNGDGNGFKLGGAPRIGDPNMGGAVHQVTHCIAVDNSACGFVRNNNPEVPMLSMCGGRGDGKGTFCKVTTTSELHTTMTAAEAIAAKRDADGNLPPAP